MTDNKGGFITNRIISTRALGVYCECTPFGCGHTGRLVELGYQPLGITGGSNILAWGDICEIIDELIEGSTKYDTLKESWQLWKKEIDIEHILNHKYCYTGWEYKKFMGKSFKNVPENSYNYKNKPDS